MRDFFFDDFHVGVPFWEDAAVVDYGGGMEEWDEFDFLIVYFDVFDFAVDLRYSLLGAHLIGVTAG